MSTTSTAFYACMSLSLFSSDCMLLYMKYVCVSVYICIWYTDLWWEPKVNEGAWNLCFCIFFLYNVANILTSRVNTHVLFSILYKMLQAKSYISISESRSGIYIYIYNWYIFKNISLKFCSESIRCSIIYKVFVHDQLS